MRPTLVWLGSAYLDLGRPDAAEPLFMKAQSLQPQSAAAVFGLGRTALARRDYTRAAEYLEQTLSLDPKASIVHYRLAMAYRGLGRLEDADAQLRQKGDHDVALTDPLLDELSGAVRSEFAYEHLGVEALNRRDFQAAIAYFRRGVELAPNDPSLRHRLGTALALSGDGPGAAAEFHEVLRRTPNYRVDSLHPGRADRRERSIRRGDRAVRRRGEGESELRRGAAATGRHAPTQRTAARVAASLRTGRRRSTLASPTRRSDRRWRSPPSNAIRRLAID